MSMYMIHMYMRDGGYIGVGPLSSRHGAHMPRGNWEAIYAYRMGVGPETRYPAYTGKLVSTAFLSGVPPVRGSTQW